MIFDKLEYAHHYLGINKNLSIGLKFILNFNKNQFSIGQINLGDGISVSIQEEKTFFEHERKYEAHRKYIDIQYLIDGDEIIMTQFIENLSVESPYNSTKDIIFFNDAADHCPLIMKPGCFAILFPHDAHKPLVRYEQTLVRKMVIKIPYFPPI
jgi:YhcH/YjgK/YiaL family protein